MDSFDAYALTVDEVAAGLISGNDGCRTADAGALLIVWHGSWLRDENFRPYIIKGEFDDSLHIAWREVGIDLGARLIEGGEPDLNVLDIAASIARRRQVMDAPPASSSSLFKTSVGFNQSRVCRGRSFSSSATASSSACVYPDRSVPFGKYCRSRPFVFSLLPRCHGE